MVLPGRTLSFYTEVKEEPYRPTEEKIRATLASL
jgi:hypothetical protein